MSEHWRNAVFEAMRLLGEGLNAVRNRQVI